MQDIHQQAASGKDSYATKPEVMFFLGVNNMGGAELSMSMLARHLHARGIATEFAVYGTRRNLISRHSHPVPVSELPVTRTWSSILPLYRLLRAKRPAFLVTALHHTNIAGLIAARLARTGTHVIVTEHGSAYKEFVAYKSRHSSIMMPLIRLLYPFADAVVAVSKGLAEEARSFLPRHYPVEVIYNPVVGTKTYETLQPAHIWLTEGQPKIVMGIGRLSKEKDFASLIRAFSALVKQRTMRLIILGEGPERATLETLVDELGIRDQVMLPGFVEQIDAWLPYASVFVSSSEHEGFGNAIVEAMANRIPVVAVDCPFGPTEILEAGRFGRMVPMHELKALTHAISEALDNPGDLNSAQMRASRFSVSRCVDDYLALMRRLATPEVRNAKNPLSAAS